MVVSTWVYTPPMRCDAPRRGAGSRRRRARGGSSAGAARSVASLNPRGRSGVGRGRLGGLVSRSPGPGRAPGEGRTQRAPPSDRTRCRALTGILWIASTATRSHRTWQPGGRPPSGRIRRVWWCPRARDAERWSRPAVRARRDGHGARYGQLVRTGRTVARRDVHLSMTGDPPRVVQGAAGAGPRRHTSMRRRGGCRRSSSRAARV
jgi:hypothetical protein